jgi:hypothetical protein
MGDEEFSGSRAATWTAGQAIPEPTQAQAQAQAVEVMAREPNTAASQWCRIRPQPGTFPIRFQQVCDPAYAAESTEEGNQCRPASQQFSTYLQPHPAPTLADINRAAHQHELAAAQRFQDSIQNCVVPSGNTTTTTTNVDKVALLFGTLACVVIICLLASKTTTPAASPASDLSTDG